MIEHSNNHGGYLMGAALKTVRQFFEKYGIDKLYSELDNKYGNGGVRPFSADRHRKLAFGVIPGFRKYDLFYERYSSAVNILLDMGAVREGTRILDVGCGEGFFKFFFDGIVHCKIEWRGVEIWKERADFCRGVGYESVLDINVDEERLPYDDGYFDVVLASHVIEHLRTPGKVLREMARVLKPGGVLLVGAPTKPPIVANLLACLRKAKAKATGETQQAFTHRSLQRMVLQEVGWNRAAVVDKRGFRLFSSRKRLPLEDWKWFYSLSAFLGKHLQALVPEVSIILKKPMRL